MYGFECNICSYLQLVIVTHQWTMIAVITFQLRTTHPLLKEEPPPLQTRMKANYFSVLDCHHSDSVGNAQKR